MQPPRAYASGGDDSPGSSRMREGFSCCLGITINHSIWDPGSCSERLAGRWTDQSHSQRAALSLTPNGKSHEKVSGLQGLGMLGPYLPFSMCKRGMKYPPSPEAR